MKSLWISEKLNYDGTQMCPLFNYLNHGLLGDSVIAFRGACDVNFSHMLDGEDLRQQAKICGSDMVHFIFEIFDRQLVSGVLLQRLFASIVKDVIEIQTQKKLQRSGDDLYFNDKKLSISIAAKSTQSVLVHFAVNVSNEGTPVPTASLQDLGLKPEAFAESCMSAIVSEWQSTLDATYKTRPV